MSSLSIMCACMLRLPLLRSTNWQLLCEKVTSLLSVLTARLYMIMIDVDSLFGSSLPHAVSMEISRPNITIE